VMFHFRSGDYRIQSPETACDGSESDEFLDCTDSLLPLRGHATYSPLEDRTWNHGGLFMRLLVGGALMFVLTVVATATLFLVARPLQERGTKNSLVLTEQEQLQCGMMEENVEYECRDLSYNVAHIEDAETCCSICGQDPQCGAWTWSRGGLCVLKVLNPDGQIGRKVKKEGVVSGLPRRQQPDYSRDLADMGLHSKIDATKHGLAKASTNYNPLEVALPALRREPSIFCFTRMLDSDVELITFQYRNHAGIFACDSYVVYTDTVTDRLQGMNVGNVQSLADVGLRGNLSSEQRMVASVTAVWKAVVSDGTYARHNWTVKVDADTVFFPSRLRPHLLRRVDSPEGIYLNNCKHGLRGALQILSRKAVANWGLGSGLCLDRFHNHRNDAPRHWDEAPFLDWCLPNVLGVTRQESFGLLVDRGCAPLPGWMACTGDLVVAFHPFRNLGAFAQCLFAALDW